LGFGTWDLGSGDEDEDAEGVKIDWGCMNADRGVVNLGFMIYVFTHFA
jgi:hypothetical protein